MYTIVSLLAEAQTAQASGGYEQYFPILLMVGFLAFFYFAVIRPQNKKKKEMQQMLSALSKGDKVITIGGVHGKVTSVKDGVVVLKIDDNATITFDKSAVAKIVEQKSGNNAEKAEEISDSSKAE